MTDQAPPAPDGCVYGPWWDGAAEYWVALVVDTPESSAGVSCWEQAYWSGPEYGLEVCCPSDELLRLAKENAELRASQPSQEDRAVLWLIKEKGWEMARSARGVWSMDGTPIASPAEEAKKLGWGG